MAIGPRNSKAQAIRLEQARQRADAQMNIREWFVLPDADSVARRHEVWSLLEWYHRTCIVPSRGVRGVIRRLWLRLRGRRWELLSPWEQIHEILEQQRRELVAAREAIESAQQREGGSDA